MSDYVKYDQFIVEQAPLKPDHFIIITGHIKRQDEDYKREKVAFVADTSDGEYNFNFYNFSTLSGYDFEEIRRPAVEHMDEAMDKVARMKIDELLQLSRSCKGITKFDL